MCVISRTTIGDITLIKRIKSEKSEEVRYYGAVNVLPRISFSQAVLVSLAPLYLSFWFFFFLLDILIYNQVTALVFFLCFFTMISLVLSAAPSFEDLRMISQAFQTNSTKSYYQMLLIFFSILTTWLIVYLYSFQGFHEFFYYLIIAGFYFLYKYGFLITKNILRWINHNWFGNRFRNHAKHHYKSYKEFVE